MSDLSDKMRKLADAGHPRATELREIALAFDAAWEADQAALAAFSALPDHVRCKGESRDRAKKFLGAWARARRLWCACSGEPLV